MNSTNFMQKAGICLMLAVPLITNFSLGQDQIEKDANWKAVLAWTYNLGDPTWPHVKRLFRDQNGKYAISENNPDRIDHAVKLTKIADDEFKIELDPIDPFENRWVFKKNDPTLKAYDKFGHKYDGKKVPIKTSYIALRKPIDKKAQTIQKKQSSLGLTDQAIKNRIHKSTLEFFPTTGIERRIWKSNEAVLEILGPKDNGNRITVLFASGHSKHGVFASKVLGNALQLKPTEEWQLFVEINDKVVKSKAATSIEKNGKQIVLKPTAANLFLMTISPAR